MGIVFFILFLPAVSHAFNPSKPCLGQLSASDAAKTATPDQAPNITKKIPGIGEEEWARFSPEEQRAISDHYAKSAELSSDNANHFRDIITTLSSRIGQSPEASKKLLEGRTGEALEGHSPEVSSLLRKKVGLTEKAKESGPETAPVKVDSNYVKSFLSSGDHITYEVDGKWRFGHYIGLDENPSDPAIKVYNTQTRRWDRVSLSKLSDTSKLQMDFQVAPLDIRQIAQIKSNEARAAQAQKIEDVKVNLKTIRGYTKIRITFTEIFMDKPYTKTAEVQYRGMREDTGKIKVWMNGGERWVPLNQIDPTSIESIP